MKKIQIKDKYKVAIIVIMIIGFAVRLIALGNVPEGLNTDEASIGYDAFSIANYGIDRNGNKLPIFLEAWGSGQNALYAYILIPFIKIFGLSVFTVRLPIALIGCIAIFVMYKLLRLIGGKKLALIGTLFLAICPWHIMKSRWGLESNLFPELVLFAIYFLELFLKQEKKYGVYLCFAFLAISTYSYGTSYLFIPILVIALLIYLFVKNKIKVSQIIIICAMVGIIVLPILLCVIINTFDLPQINLPFMTIPKTLENRVSTNTIFGSENILGDAVEATLNSFNLLAFQNDGSMYNVFQFYGITYVFSLIFTLIGICYSFKREKFTPINIWFLTSLLLFPTMVDVNINRLNVIMFPIIYYTIYGINVLSEELNNKTIKLIIILLYIISFITFEDYYFTHSSSKNTGFTSGLKEVVEYVSKLDVKDVYVTNSIDETYIYFLFYSKANTHEFVNTVEHFRNYDFNDIKGYGKYHFYLPENNIDPYTKVAFEVPEENLKDYVVVKKKDEVTDKEKEKYNIKEIGDYIIEEKK